MWENVIGFQIRRANRNLLLTNAVLLVLLALGAYAAQRYLYNCFRGPFATSEEALLRISSLDSLDRYFISVDQLKTIETGVQQTETKDGNPSSKRVTATFFAARVAAKFLLIKSPSETPAAAYQGALVTMPTDLRDHFQKKLDPNNRKFDDVFLPYLLDTGTFRDGAWWGLAFGIPLAILALYNVLKAVRRMNDMEASPVARSLQRFGQPPASVAMAIDQDLKANGDASPIPNLSIGSSWILREMAFGLDILHRNEILWVYQKVTQHRTNFIPTGKTYSLVIGDERGRRIEVAVGGRQRKERLDALIQTMVARIPWVVAGYNDQLRNEFDKNRAAFAAAVGQRRAQHLG